MQLGFPEVKQPVQQRLFSHSVGLAPQSCANGGGGDGDGDGGTPHCRPVRPHVTWIECAGSCIARTFFALTG